MQKYMIPSIIIATIIFITVPALAQDEKAQLAKLESLYEQLTAIKKKIADVKTDLGLITPEQNSALKDRLDQRHRQRMLYNFQCPGPRGPHGPGLGLGPGGWWRP